jgi:hypothetical protein
LEYSIHLKDLWKLMKKLVFLPFFAAALASSLPAMTASTPSTSKNEISVPAVSTREAVDAQPGNRNPPYDQ